MAQPPVFLAKTRYRQRRLRDGLRMLPVLGALLWMIPLLWPRGADGQSNATALIYMFSVWTMLVVLCALLVRFLRPEDNTPPPTEPG